MQENLQLLPATTAGSAHPPPIALPTGVVIGGPVEYRLASQPCGIVIVGEAPGRDEVAQSEPFVGKAGQHLDEILKEVGLKRHQVDFTNVFRHRPDGNQITKFFARPGSAYAINQKLPQYGTHGFVFEALANDVRLLWKFLKWRQPKVIVAAGTTAAWGALGISGKRMTDLRGNWHPCPAVSNAPALVTWHPSYSLRTLGSDGQSEARNQLAADLQVAASKATSN